MSMIAPGGASQPNISPRRPVLWVTYAWTDNDEGTFDYLVQELVRAGIDVRFDKVRLIPGQRLWDQIGDEILSSDVDGWAYLITPASLSSPACREELGFALLRVLDRRTPNWPAIGLVTSGVSMDDVPPSLRIRLCIHMQGPDWREEILAGLQMRAPQRAVEERGRYAVTILKSYGGNPSLLAVEVRPHFGEIRDWRLAVPDSADIVAWGITTPGRPLANLRHLTVAVEDTVTISGVASRYFGANDPISPGSCAVVVLRQPVPDRLWISEGVFPGVATSQWMRYSIG